MIIFRYRHGPAPPTCVLLILLMVATVARMRARGRPVPAPGGEPPGDLEPVAIPDADAATVPMTPSGDRPSPTMIHTGGPTMIHIEDPSSTTIDKSLDRLHTIATRASESDPAQVDPDPMPDSDARAAGAGAALRATREYLGLKTPWLASWLGVAVRMLERWEDDLAPVPVGVLRELDELDVATQELENDFFDALDAADAGSGEPLTLWTYRTDADLRAHNPGSPMPASWHRAMAARLARSGIEVVVRYR